MNELQFTYYLINIIIQERGFLKYGRFYHHDAELRPSDANEEVRVF